MTPTAKAFIHLPLTTCPYTPAPLVHTPSNTHAPLHLYPYTLHPTPTGTMISEMDAEPDAPVCILPQFGQITMVKGFATIDNVALIDVAVGFLGGGTECVGGYRLYVQWTIQLHNRLYV